MARTIGAKDKLPRKTPVRNKKYVEPSTIPDFQKESGYIYRWVRADLLKGSKKIKVANRSGWKPVRATEQSSLVPFSSKKTTIEIGGLVLCKMKEEEISVNWEKLAKELQTALRNQIAENQEYEKLIKNLNFEIANARHKEIGYQAVISYLESKRGNTTV